MAPITLKAYKLIFYLTILYSAIKPSAFLTPTANDPLQTFLVAAEQLVMDSIDRALNATINVYNNWKLQMTSDLCRLACPLMQTYMDVVKRVQQQNASEYTEKRQLLSCFRNTNAKIGTLQAELLQKGLTHFLYTLISKEFYRGGCNTTEFDNLYLDFMQKFEEASQNLWRNMGEMVVEEQEELLEILDEISDEENFREKDKLYDEFIEMYLFKNNKKMFN